MVRNDALAGPLPLPTQLRVKAQHPQQVPLSPRQPTICSTHNHHFFCKCKDLSHHVGPAPVVSTSSQPLLSGHPNSHSLYYSGLTLATRNTYSIRLLHTSHW